MDEQTQIPPNQILNILHQELSQYSGPLPHPEILKQYEEILPGISERIFTNFEKQTNHRIELEKKQQEEDFVLAKQGQNYALTIAIFGILSSLAAIYLGSPTVAGILGGSTIIGLVTAFINGNKIKQQERENIRTELNSPE